MADDNSGFEDGPVSTRRRSVSNGPDSGCAGGSIDPASLDSGTGPGSNPSGSGSGSDDGDDGYLRDGDGNVRRNRDGSPRKKRRRKAEGSRAHAGDLKASVEALAILVQFGQGMFAMVAAAPEMELNREESVAIGGAVAPVLELADVSIDPRIAKIAVALGTVAAIQAPHIAMWRMRLAEERASKAKPVKGFETQPAAPADMATAFGGYSGPVEGAVN